VLFKITTWTNFAQANILGILLAMHIIMINVKSEPPQLTDFFQFYQSARYFLQGESIYTPILFYPSEKFIARMTDKAKESIKYLFPNMNSPLHTFLMTPFAILPFPQAFWSWSILSLLFGFLAVGLIILNATTQLPNKFTSFLNLSIILLGYFPTFANNMLGGQWGLCLLLFVVLIWHTARREKYMSAGIILGIAMSSKIIFALFLLYFFMSRMWKILAWSLSTFSIMNIIGIFIFGIPEYKQHILNLETVPQFINASWNASCAAFFSRIFGGAENIPLVMIPSLAHALSLFFSVLLIIGVLRSAWFQANDRSLKNFDIGFSFTTVSMLLISPVGWMYYFPILILPMFVIWNSSASLRSCSRYRFSAVFFWLISSIPTEFIPSVFKDLDEPLLWFTSAGYYFYALVALSLILLIMSTKFYKHKEHIFVIAKTNA
jgi:hypothetical protein